MEDLIDERDRRERIAKSIIKRQNVIFVTNNEGRISSTQINPSESNNTKEIYEQNNM